mmetsp:Transcript_28403/g.86826  ORF Transcript_28403/g.86826 Transcript_28403/m.86826 type:complete len:98 (-) Transcript_28403:4944-5237(-)
MMSDDHGLQVFLMRKNLAPFPSSLWLRPIQVASLITWQVMASLRRNITKEFPVCETSPVHHSKNTVRSPYTSLVTTAWLLLDPLHCGSQSHTGEEAL